jgi:hypothetical protein
LKSGLPRLAAIDYFYPRTLPHRETSEMIEALKIARKNNVDVVFGDRPYLVSIILRSLHPYVHLISQRYGITCLYG